MLTCVLTQALLAFAALKKMMPLRRGRIHAWIKEAGRMDHLKHKHTLHALGVVPPSHHVFKT